MKSHIAAAFAVALAVGLPAGPALAQSDARQALAETAAQAEEPVLWYESSSEEQIDKVISAFNNTYPDVNVEHVRVAGGNKVVGLVVQEMQARGYTGDVITAGASRTWAINDRGHLMSVDWQEFGVKEELTPVDFAVATAASVYTILVNTDAVPEGERPGNWDALLDSKWKGKIGTWVVPGAFAQLAKAAGQDEAQAKLERLVELEPLLYKSTFPMAQSTAAGEVDVSLGFFHTAQPPIDAGAPLARIALDPTPMHTIYTSVTKAARNPAGAKLLTAWLASPEGAKAYEAATNRGSPMIEGTRTAELVAGVETTEYPADETDTYSAVMDRFNKILGAAGTAR